MLGTPKNRLIEMVLHIIEMVLLSTQKKALKLMDEKIFSYKLYLSGTTGI